MQIILNGLKDDDFGQHNFFEPLGTEQLGELTDNIYASLTDCMIVILQHGY